MVKRKKKAVRNGIRREEDPIAVAVAVVKGGCWWLQDVLRKVRMREEISREQSMDGERIEGSDHEVLPHLVLPPQLHSQRSREPSGHHCAS